MSEDIKNEEKAIEYGNAEVADRILVSGTDEELEQLREFHGLSHEQIDLSRYYSRQREAVHEKQGQDVAARKFDNPKATDEELSMGTYIEDVEPQVRDVVLRLLKKGYSTVESGFYGDNRQAIGFNSVNKIELNFSEQVISDLKEKGVEISLEDNYLFLSFTQKMSIDEIDKIWGVVEKEIEPSSQKASANETEGAKDFREKQKEL